MYRKQKYKVISMILVFLLAVSIFTACTANKPQVPNPPAYTPTPLEPLTNTQTQPPEPVDEKIEGYMPLAVGNRWEYEGEGSDMATYTQEVTYSKGNRYQIKTTAGTANDGRNVTTNIFEVREDSIANVYLSMGDNKNFLNESDTVDITLLKLPIAVGTKWVSEQNSYEIVQTDAKVTVPYGTFDNCMIVRLTFYDGSIMNMYYKKDIGMVLSEFTTNRDTITSRLKNFISK